MSLHLETGGISQRDLAMALAVRKELDGEVLQV
jgi:hypothetical protein